MQVPGSTFLLHDPPSMKRSDQSVIPSMLAFAQVHGHWNLEELEISDCVHLLRAEIGCSGSSPSFGLG